MTKFLLPTISNSQTVKEGTVSSQKFVLLTKYFQDHGNECGRGGRGMSRVWEKKYANRVFWGNLKGRRHLEGLGLDRDNNKMDCKEM